MAELWDGLRYCNSIDFKVNVIKEAHNHAEDYLNRVVYDVWLVVDYWYTHVGDKYEKLYTREV